MTAKNAGDPNRKTGINKTIEPKQRKLMAEVKDSMKKVSLIGEDNGSERDETSNEKQVSN